MRPVRIFSALQAAEPGWRGVAGLAGVQRGLVSLGQCHHAGLSRAAIRFAVATGWLSRVLPRVFAVGTAVPGPGAGEVAALLHIGHDVAVGHRSSAALWELVDAPGDAVELTVIGRGLRPRPGIELHRVPWLDARDVRIRHGIPVTSPARTLIDLGSAGEPDLLEEALARARVRRLVADGDLRDAIARAPGRTGVAPLRRLLRAGHGDAPTRSGFERTLHRVVAAAGLPAPRACATVLGFEVDALWPPERLVLECDGWRFHGDRAAFERDRLRDQTLLAHGYRVIRITWRQLSEEPLAVVARLAATLAVAG